MKSTQVWSGWLLAAVLACPTLAQAKTPSPAATAATLNLSPKAQEAAALLDARDSYKRQWAFMRLEALREPASGALVRSYLTHRNPDTRSFAARALAAIEGQAAIPTLLERLRTDRDSRVRIEILLGLEPLNDPTLLPVFIDMMRDRDSQVRITALDIVSRIDRPQAKEAVLTRWARERDRDVQRVLPDALQRVTASSGG